MRILSAFLMVLFFMLSISATAAETVRERRVLTVQGQREEWLVKWSGAVKPVCSSRQLSEAVTCPCSGFAYGEQGQLVVERRRPGASVERLDVSKLFGDYDSPADAGNAALARVPRHPEDPADDSDVSENAQRFKRTVQGRAPVSVMKFGDFSHDGMQASFLLQVGNAPCGKRQMALIGVSRRDPHLHAFSTAAHPERPLVLQAPAWQALMASKGHAQFTAWACGDHGGDTEIEQVIDARDGRFMVRENTFACRDDGSRGNLLEHENL
jgi:hypothetical protein